MSDAPPRRGAFCPQMLWCDSRGATLDEVTTHKDNCRICPRFLKCLVYMILMSVVERIIFFCDDTDDFHTF